MEATLSKSRLLVIFVAIATAVVLAIGVTALPTQANAAGYKIGSSASLAKSTYKTSKSKAVGTWKLIGSNLSYEKQILKYQKKKGIINKIQFKRNGVAIEKNYKKSPYKYKWIANSKSTGYLIAENRIIAKFSVQGKKLTLKSGTLKRKYSKM